MAPEFYADDERGPAGQRPKVLPPQHSEIQLAVIRCGERRGGHRVRVHRGHWPPRGMVRPNEPMGPHVDGPCLDCGATVQIYNPPGSKVTVILHGAAAEAQGQVIDEEPGAVIDEADLPAGGTVVDEVELPNRRRATR